VCVHAPVTGVAAVVCTCSRPAPPACGAGQLPPGVRHILGKACASVARVQSDLGPGVRRRMLATSLARWEDVAHQVSYARQLGRLEPACTRALRAEAAVARDRIRAERRALQRALSRR